MAAPTQSDIISDELPSGVLPTSARLPLEQGTVLFDAIRRHFKAAKKASLVVDTEQLERILRLAAIDARLVVPGLFDDVNLLGIGNPFFDKPISTSFPLLGVMLSEIGIKRPQDISRRFLDEKYSAGTAPVMTSEYLHMRHRSGYPFDNNPGRILAKLLGPERVNYVLATARPGVISLKPAKVNALGKTEAFVSDAQPIPVGPVVEAHAASPAPSSLVEAALAQMAVLRDEVTRGGGVRAIPAEDVVGSPLATPAASSLLATDADKAGSEPGAPPSWITRLQTVLRDDEATPSVRADVRASSTIADPSFSAADGSPIPSESSEPIPSVEMPVVLAAKVLSDNPLPTSPTLTQQASKAPPAQPAMATALGAAPLVASFDPMSVLTERYPLLAVEIAKAGLNSVGSLAAYIKEETGTAIPLTALVTQLTTIAKSNSLMAGARPWPVIEHTNLAFTDHPAPVIDLFRTAEQLSLSKMVEGTPVELVTPVSKPLIATPDVSVLASTLVSAVVSQQTNGADQGLTEPMLTSDIVPKDVPAEPIQQRSNAAALSAAASGPASLSNGKPSVPTVSEAFFAPVAKVITGRELVYRRSSKNPNIFFELYEMTNEQGRRLVSKEQRTDNKIKADEDLTQSLLAAGITSLDDLYDRRERKAFMLNITVATLKKLQQRAKELNINTKLEAGLFRATGRTEPATNDVAAANGAMADGNGFNGGNHVLSASSLAPLHEPSRTNFAPAAATTLRPVGDRPPERISFAQRDIDALDKHDLHALRRFMDKLFTMHTMRTAVDARAAGSSIIDVSALKGSSVSVVLRPKHGQVDRDLAEFIARLRLLDVITDRPAGGNMLTSGFINRLGEIVDWYLKPPKPVVPVAGEQRVKEAQSSHL